MDPLIILMGFRARWPHSVGALRHAHHDQRAGADGLHHGDRVATSNSILMVTFATNSGRPQFGGLDARSAALAAGRTRLRPVLMTALAILLGMLPMSLGLGEGGSRTRRSAGR